MKIRLLKIAIPITLLLFVGVLIHYARHLNRAMPVLAAAPASHSGLADIIGGDSLPPMEIHDLPSVIFDNTCESGQHADLSGCTGMLSGGEVREYRIILDGDTRALQIELEARDPFLDLSFALYDAQGRCRAAGDEQPAGWTERATLSRLEAGEYRLLVGGYADHCGPYLLTVRAPELPAVQLTGTTIQRGPNGSAIRWTSFGEVNFAHFSLFRVDAEDRLRIATFRGHGGAAQFGEYRFLDREGGADAAYELEAVSRDGRREVFSLG